MTEPDQPMRPEPDKLTGKKSNDFTDWPQAIVAVVALLVIGAIAIALILR